MMTKLVSVFASKMSVIIKETSAIEPNNYLFAQSIPITHFETS